MSPLLVRQTPTADAQVAGLRGPAKKTYEAFLTQLSAQGCAALGYRLTGPEPLPRLCVKHLRGADRAVVAFVDDEAWVLLVGPHSDKDPRVDVYTALYTLVGVEPEDQAKRTKPSCCDGDGDAPEVDPAEVDALVSRAKSLGRRPRGA